MLYGPYSYAINKEKDPSIIDKDTGLPIGKVII